MTARFASVDDYLGSLPEPTRAVMDELRRTMRAVVPDVGEKVSYQMPTFTLDGTSLVHIAAWKNHIGLYPLSPLDGDLARDIAPYRGVEDAMQLPRRGPGPTGRSPTARSNASTPPWQRRGAGRAGVRSRASPGSTGRITGPLRAAPGYSLSCASSPVCHSRTTMLASSWSLPA